MYHLHMDFERSKRQQKWKLECLMGPYLVLLGTQNLDKHTLLAIWVSILQVTSPLFSHPPGEAWYSLRMRM